MPAQTFSALGQLQSTETKRDSLPALKDTIKSLKDGAYPVLRFAYLTGYDYYIIETEKFKVNLYPKNNPSVAGELGKLVENSQPQAVYVYIEGVNHAYLMRGADGGWKEYCGQKANSYEWYGEKLEFEMIPEKEVIDWDSMPF